ncbi:GBF-interacting protein 1-like isoform X2 [Impatiens glandulifera]|uniref:GBF-interacting protein 1-like isoform X2 n=1 Tax=Impatiens glandulifera TaxID=253017 RepID=UPI001FB07C1B|nr:GBF-interacting protein 1-like isoform X2 [Impatiens glandulifera]
MSTRGSRVSIPNSVRKTIQHIKEITGNHSEDDIYAMLKECSMDPNETTQKLLFQDTFHEVKRRRDRRKENVNNKESGESKWRPGIQGRGNRGGRGSYSPRYTASDDVGGRNAPLGKENGTDQLGEKSGGLSILPISQLKNKDTVTVTSSVTAVSNSPTVEDAIHLPSGGSVNELEGRSAVEMNNLVSPPIVIPPIDTKQKSSTTVASHELLGLGLSNNLTPRNQASSSGVYFSASDPVLVPSQDTRLPGSIGAIKREVGSQRAPVEHISVVSQENKPNTEASEVRNSSMPEKMPAKSVKKQESAQLPQSRTSTAVNRPFSNYNSRSHQSTGLAKALPAKEWKPKHAKSGATTMPDVHSTVENDVQAQVVCHDLDSSEPAAASDVQRKLEDLQFPQGLHVIIPNHLHVPEDLKVGFVFGSFDVNYGSKTGCDDVPKAVEETIEQSSSIQNAIEASQERDYADQPESPEQVQESSSPGEINTSSNEAPEYKESDQEVSLHPTSHPYPLIHTSSGYNFGYMPTVVGGQLPPFDSSESQARDVPHIPSFVAPQPFDPSSYYGQFFRAGVDTDGRISPFHSTGPAVLTSQSSAEGGNSVVLSITSGPSSVVAEATGIMQSSLPVFRQPTGMHLTHYPPNYISYGPYYPPFYVPHTSLHQFFPQQPQLGSIYQVPPLGTASKYPFSQYKPGINSGNSNHGGVPISFGSYGSSPVSFINHSSAASTSANSTVDGDLTGQQYKENNVYISGQQTEGSTLWIAAPGQDISGLHPSSFYNIPPPHAQMNLAPNQAGHGTFAGIYHPQAVTAAAPIVLPLVPHSSLSMAAAASVDMVAPTAPDHQQPQHSQTNLPNNY